MNAQKLLADVKAGNTESKWKKLSRKGDRYLESVRALNFTFLQDHVNDVKNDMPDWREILKQHADLLTANEKSVWGHRTKEVLAPIVFHLAFDQAAMLWLQKSGEAEVEAFLAHSSLDELAQLFTVSKDDFLRLACGLKLETEEKEDDGLLELLPIPKSPDANSLGGNPYPFPLIPTEKLEGLSRADIEKVIKGRGLLMLATEYDATTNPVLKGALATVAETLVPMTGEIYCPAINRYQHVAGFLSKDTLASVARLIYHAIEERTYDANKAFVEHETDQDILAVANALEMTYQDAFDAITQV